MLLRALLVLIFAGCLAATGFTVPESIIDDGLAPAEKFLNDTIRRINDAWMLSEIEFERAGNEAEEIPEQIAERIKERASETIKKAVNESVDEAVERAGDRIEETVEYHINEYD